MKHVDDWTKLEQLGREDRALRYLAKARAEKSNRAFHVFFRLLVTSAALVVAVIVCLAIWHFYLGGI